ncbi:MAG: hypothetical protein PHE70_12055 [Tepidanaerobacteraceae bacterium]|nr:hypothetical protein [Tepidanaerobacteraceae bacterium]
MASKIPFKVNSAGRWISTATGRFAKKADYLPYLEKKLKADAARAVGVKDYWDAVKVVMKVNNITNVKEGRAKLTEEINVLKQTYSGLKKLAEDSNEQKRYTIKDDKHARKLLMTKKKYANYSNKKSLHDVWAQFKKEKADKARRKEVFSKYEADQTELVS